MFKTILDNKDIYIKEEELIFIEGILQVNIYIIQNDTGFLKKISKYLMEINKETSELKLEDKVNGFKKIKELTSTQLNKLSNASTPKALAPLILTALMTFTSLSHAHENFNHSDISNDSTAEMITDIRDNDGFFSNKADVQITGNFKGDIEKIQELNDKLNDMIITSVNQTGEYFSKKVPKDGEKIQEYFDEQLQVKLVFDKTKQFEGNASFQITKTGLDSEGNITDLISNQTNEITGETVKFAVVEIIIPEDNVQDLLTNYELYRPLIANMVKHEVSHLAGYPIFKIMDTSNLHSNKSVLPEKVSCLAQNEIGEEVSIDLIKKLFPDLKKEKKRADYAIETQSELVDITLNRDNYSEIQGSIIDASLKMTNQNFLAEFNENPEIIYTQIKEMLGKRNTDDSIFEYGFAHIAGEGMGDTLMKLGQMDGIDVELLQTDYLQSISFHYLNNLYQNIIKVSQDKGYNQINELFDQITIDMEIDSNKILNKKVKRMSSNGKSKKNIRTQS